MHKNWHSVVFKVDGNWTANSYNEYRDAVLDAMAEFDHASISDNDIHYIAVYYTRYPQMVSDVLRNDPEKTFHVKEL